MERKLIFFDIDGTLTSARRFGHVYESTRKALAMLKENGHFLALATGRAAFRARQFQQEINILNMVCEGGNEIIIYPDGSAHLTATGGLAGSTLNINKGLRILVEEALVPFNYALNSCTINPAKCLHLDDRKGSIQVGKDADLVVLEDNYDVLQTYCMGQPKL